MRQNMGLMILLLPRTLPCSEMCLRVRRRKGGGGAVGSPLLVNSRTMLLSIGAFTETLARALWTDAYSRDDNTTFYYTTKAVRGPITKFNQSDYFIAGPIFSKYRTGYCPECVKLIAAL